MAGIEIMTSLMQACRNGEVVSGEIKLSFDYEIPLTKHLYERNDIWRLSRTVVFFTVVTWSNQRVYLRYETRDIKTKTIKPLLNNIKRNRNLQPKH